MKKMLFSFISILVLLGGASLAFAQASDSEVKAWAEKVAVEVMTFDHTNYEERKAENMPYFTEKGSASFYEALAAAWIPAKIAQEKSAVTAVLKCPPYVTEVQDFPNFHVWQVDFPLELTYTGEQGTSSVVQIVAMNIEQNPATKSLGISQWISMPFLEGDRHPCLTELSVTPAPANE
jgi:hypothetical protein